MDFSWPPLQNVTFVSVESEAETIVKLLHEHLME